jgi:hypothetical protein
VYEVKFEGSGNQLERNCMYVKLIVNVDGDRRRLFVGRLDNFFIPDESRDEASRRLLMFALDRVRDLVEASPDLFAVYTTDALEAAVSREEAARLLAAAAKHCEWLVEARGAPFCGAAAQNDETARTVDNEWLAPTTPALCAGCEVPDSRLKCSSFIHPEVRNFGGAGDPFTDRSLLGAYCARGIDAPDQECVPGGRDCWHATWEPRVAETDVPSPQALHEALEFLRVQWKARFKIDFIDRVPIDALGGLTAPVGDRDGFKARMSDLAAVVDRMLSGVERPESVAKEQWQGSLNRVEAYLTANAVTLPDDAIPALRNVIDVRAALQHPTDRDLPAALAKCGISVPVVNWEQAWHAIQRRTLDALVELRVAIRDSE